MRHSSSRYNTRGVWQVYRCPTDILRRIGVRVVRVTTSDAFKRRLGFAVGFADCVANSALPRRIARINKDNGHTGTLGLVGHKTLQLAEGPTVQTSSFAFSSPYPVANTAQFFQSDSATGAFCDRYKLFGNSVVDVGSEASFTAPAFTEQTFSRSGAERLKSLSDSAMAGTQSVQLPTSKTDTVACVRNRYDAQVNTDKVLNLAFFDIGHVNRSEQKPESVACHQVRFASPECKQFALPLAAHKWNGLPSLDRPNTDPRFSEIVSENSVIERDRTKRPELALSFLIKLVSVSHLGDQPDHNLSRKVELFADRLVKETLQRKPPKFSSGPSLFAEPITSAISYLKRAFKNTSLIGGRLQFDLYGQLHYQQPYSNI